MILQTAPANEETAWIHAIAHLYRCVTSDDDEKVVSIESGGEIWEVTNSKYSAVRHRLSIEFDGGDFYVVLEYSAPNQMLNVRAWQDRRMTSDDTKPSADDEGLDKYSVCVLQMVYLPKVGLRPKSEKGLKLRDSGDLLCFAHLEQVALFAYLVGVLEEHVGIETEKRFDFQSACLYAKEQQVLLAAFRMLKRGMMDLWEDLRQDCDTLSDC